MASDLFSRYIWIVDTISRYGTITRQRLNELWERSSIGNGRPMPERTFFYYRRAIEENFHIDIRCNDRGEYYIWQPKGNRDKAFSNWLLDSYAIGNAMQGPETAELVMVDDVPSAREFLPAALEAARDNRRIIFSYAGFRRSRVEKGIRFDPYFLRLYKQRWYMIGYKVGEKINTPSRGIRTYALDRVKELQITGETFERPENITTESIFGNLVGITASHAPVKIVRLRTTPTQAKYLRALPLHESQSEETHETHSIFTYRLKLNYELVHEILALGDAVEVLDPPELRLMLLEELNRLNKLYKQTGPEGVNK